ncbi:MAG: segregation/condensation protein A [Sphaerochaetaceae bacterium]|nr:segregation/condensation protein A [Sphaerochaetaceae bacterium]
MAIDFHVPGYDGPLDVLLDIIHKNEINIYDIPVSLITEQFLQYIKNEEKMALRDLSDFYRMAAELIWIKSQLLLPVKVEFDEEFIDPRQDLVERLLEYSRFKKYSELLMGIEADGSLNVQRKSAEFNMPFSDAELWEDVGLDTLLEVYARLLEHYSAEDEKVFNVYEEVTENEKIALMNEILETRDSFSFSELFVKPTKMNIVCSFLAVLDAVKDKMVLVSQKEPFMDIIITKRPEDWNPDLADDYDDEYDEIVKNKLADEDNFSVVDD